MLENRIALSKIFTSILYLANQGLALRGHEETHSNLYVVLKLRCQDVPELRNWMNRPGHKWLSGTVVNEIISMLANEIRNQNL